MPALRLLSKAARRNGRRNGTTDRHRGSAARCLSWFAMPLGRPLVRGASERPVAAGDTGIPDVSQVFLAFLRLPNVSKSAPQSQRRKPEAQIQATLTKR